MHSRRKSTARSRNRRFLAALLLVAALALFWGCKDLEKSDFLDADVPSGELVWAVSGGGPSHESAQAIDVFPNGDIVVVGQLGQGDVLFQTEPGGDDTGFLVGSDYVVFVAKYEPSGALIWLKKTVGFITAMGRDVVTAPSGYSFVVGDFYQWAVFGEGESGEVFLGQTLQTREFAFFALYAMDGSLAWAKQIDSDIGDSHARSVAVYSGVDDPLYFVTGDFSGDAVLGEGEPGEALLSTDPGTTSLFLVAYEQDGNVFWAIQADGASIGQSVVSLSDGSVLVAGTFSDSVVFGTGGSDETAMTTVGNLDGFLARYTLSGTLVWAKQFGDMHGEDDIIMTALGDDSVLVAGTFSGLTTLGASEPTETTLTADGDRDVFFAKYATSDGSLIWARRLGGSDEDRVRGAASLSDGGFVLSGVYWGTAFIGTYEQVDIFLGAVEDGDMFIAGFDTDGNLRFVRSDGGEGYAASTAISESSAGSFAVTGVFGGTSVFGAGEPNETSFTSQGIDLFVMRVDF